MPKLKDTEILRRAAAILDARGNYTRKFVSDPNIVKTMFLARHDGLTAEQFDIVFLDNRHGILETRTMFHGTIDSAAVYPREVVRACIETNAAAIILAHNHPSGIAEPSRADIDITNTLRNVLKVIDVRVLDHIITGRGVCVSLAERGEL